MPQSLTFTNVKDHQDRLNKFEGLLDQVRKYAEIYPELRIELMQILRRFLYENIRSTKEEHQKKPLAKASDEKTKLNDSKDIKDVSSPAKHTPSKPKI